MNWLTLCARRSLGYVCFFSVVYLAVLEGTALAEPKLRPIRFMKSNQASKRDTGSAHVLAGRVYVHHIFCADGHSSWSGFDENRVLDQMQAAFGFISMQSRRRGKSVEFVEEVGLLAKIDGRIPTDSRVNPVWTEQMIKKSSGRSGLRLVEELRANRDVDSVILCLHVNKPALSYNLAYYDNVALRYNAERMVCFRLYPDGRETAAATYAHEILHLFGAGDLYFPYDSNNRRKDRAQRLFPNDIMFRVDYNLDRLNVGPFTAFRVGWSDKLDPAYRVFED